MKIRVKASIIDTAQKDSSRVGYQQGVISISIYEIPVKKRVKKVFTISSKYSLILSLFVVDEPDLAF